MTVEKRIRDTEEGIAEKSGEINMGEADVKLTNLGSAIMTMIKAIVGGGLLGLPYAFQKSGWALGLIAFPLIAILTRYCMLLLINVKEYCHMSRTCTAGDVASAAFGNVGKRIVDVVLVIDSLGCCLSYFMFITANMELLTGLRQEAWAGIFFVILLLATFIRPLKLISYAAYGANVCVGVGAILLTIAVFVACGEPVGEVKAFNWKDFSIFVGIVLFAYQATELALPVHNSLKDTKKFPLGIAIVLSVVCVLYVAFGMSSYLYLRENENLSMITKAINADKYLGFQIAIVVLFIVILFVNILCWIFPVYEVADRVFHANQFRVISKAKQAQILSENENITNAKSPVNVNPYPLTPPSVTVPNPDFDVAHPSWSSTVVMTSGRVADVEREREVEMKSDTSPETGPDTAPETGPDTAPETGPDTAPETGPDTAPETGPDIAPDTTPDIEPDTTPGVGVASEPAVVVASVPAVVPVPLQVEEEEEDESFWENVWKNKKFWFLTTLGRIVTLLIIVIPSVTPVRTYFSSFIGLLGGTAGIFMTFIFPPSCRVKVEWKTLPLKFKILDLCICILSIPVMIFITVLNLIDLINSLKKGM